MVPPPSVRSTVTGPSNSDPPSPCTTSGRPASHSIDDVFPFTSTPVIVAPAPSPRCGVVTVNGVGSAGTVAASKCPPVTVPLTNTCPSAGAGSPGSSDDAGAVRVPPLSLLLVCVTSSQSRYTAAVAPATTATTASSPAKYFTGQMMAGSAGPQGTCGPGPVGWQPCHALQRSVSCANPDG